MKFGTLTTLGNSYIDIDKRRKYACKCACGTLKIIREDALKSGATISCGCEKKKRVAAACTTHGLSNSRTFRIYKGMLARCNNPNRDNYKHYGGRGIKVCKRWRKFVNFLEDMGEAPENMSIDRINVNGNYTPANCQWADKYQQARNRQ